MVENPIDVFLTAQIHAIEKSVYIESEKARRNLRLDLEGRPTDDFFLDWINMHADKFRDAWQISVCKDCARIKKCYDCLKQQCPSFEPG